MAGFVHDVLLLQSFHDDPSSLCELVATLTSRRLPQPLQPIELSALPGLPGLLDRPGESCPAVAYRAGTSWLVGVVLSEIDDEKRCQWRRIAAALYGSTGRMGEVVVITTSAAVARWAHRAARVRGRHSLGSEIGLSQVVFHVKERDAATLIERESPRLALCAVWAMRERGGPLAWRIVEGAIELTNRLAEPLRDRQLLAIFNLMGESMQSSLCEDSMNPIRASENPTTRTLRLRMEAAGARRARPEIRAETKREAVMMLLAERGLRPTADERDRIETCDDLLQLDAWFKRALAIGTVTEMFGP